MPPTRRRGHSRDRQRVRSDYRSARLANQSIRHTKTVHAAKAGRPVKVAHGKGKKAHFVTKPSAKVKTQINCSIWPKSEEGRVRQAGRRAAEGTALAALEHRSVSKCWTLWSASRSRKNQNDYDRNCVAQLDKLNRTRRSGAAATSG